MEKPRKIAERAAKRPAAKLPATSESAESTLNDLDFQERFVDFYRGEIDRGGWLVEEKSYPLVALQAFRRWLNRFRPNMSEPSFRPTPNEMGWRITAVYYSI